MEDKLGNSFSNGDTIKILATHIPKGQDEDDLDQKLTKSGKFSVKSGYWFLNKRSSTPQTEAQFQSSIWNSDIFPKWKHFMWKIAVKEIQTASNIGKRKIPVDIQQVQILQSRNGE